LLYAQIGRRIAENRFDSVSVRAVVPAMRKPVLVLRGFIPLAVPGMNSARPPLAQAAFLLAAVDDIRPRNRRSEQPRLAGPGVRARVIWLIDFLARLERQETFGRRPQFVGEGTVDILPPDRNKMLTLPQQALNATMRRQTSSP
jgi:hypothetical protein